MEKKDQVLQQSKELVELFSRLQENLSKSSDKNESLLEAIESSEAKAAETGVNGEISVLRNLRARLAAVHTPSSALRRDLISFSGLFEKRFNELQSLVKSYENLHQALQRNQHDMEIRLKNYEEERKAFEKERSEWKEERERERQELLEQNDRLTLLSEQLTGTKMALDAKSNELASQRIAFEEEKLFRSVGFAADSEAEAIRKKLSEQVLQNIELENALLKTELALHQKEEMIKAADNRNNRLQKELVQSKLASTRAVKQFERKTAETNQKLIQMAAELEMAQEHARRFQETLAVERRKQKGLAHALEQELQKSSASADVLTPAAQKAFLATLSDQLSNPHKPKTPVRIDDIVRKNETVLVENASLKADIQRLRVENEELMKKVRFADSNAYYMRNQVVTNVADRAELIKRLDRTEAQYRELEQSLAKQASDWIAQKRLEAQKEKDTTLRQIKPIPLLGASERTWNSPSRPQPMSRSIPVHKW